MGECSKDDSEYQQIIIDLCSRFLNIKINYNINTLYPENGVLKYYDRIDWSAIDSDFKRL